VTGEGCRNFIGASVGRIGWIDRKRLTASKWNAVAKALNAHCSSDSDILLRKNRRNISQIEKKNCNGCKHDQQNDFPNKNFPHNKLFASRLLLTSFSSPLLFPIHFSFSAQNKNQNI